MTMIGKPPAAPCSRCLMAAIVYLLFVAWGVCLAFPEQSAENDAGNNIEVLARQEFETGSYSAACRDFDRFAQANPSSALAWSNFGVACHMAGNIQQAVGALERSLKLDSHILAANLILGIDYIRLERPRDAVPLLQRVLHQQPDNRDALIDLASANIALQDYTAAIDNFRTEVKFRPRDADAWYGMGLSFEHIAEQTSRQLASVGHNSSYFHHLVGSYLLDQGLLLDAEDAFRKALAANSPRDQDLHAELGFALLRLHKLADAAQEFHQEIAADPHNQLAWLGLGTLETEKSDFSKALEVICGIQQRDPAFFARNFPLAVESLSEPAKSGMAQHLSSGGRGCSPSMRRASEGSSRIYNVPGACQLRH